MSDLSSTHVGLNVWGDVVMYCEICRETFAKKLQTETLQELVDLAGTHTCDPINVRPVVMVGEAKFEAASEYGDRLEL